jgi:lysyl-tRNA synthetase class 1
MDEYNELENIFFGKIKIDNPAKETKMKGLYEYVNLLNIPKTLTPYVSYRLLIEISRIFKEKRTELVMKKLIDYGVLKNPEPQIEDLITMAGNYADDFDLQEKVEVQIDDATKKALRELADLLEADDEPDDLQNTIYQIAKKNNVQPKDFFKILYQIILSTNRGPKIGPFILDIGRKKVSQTLASYL